jgi:hypothetical protein
MIYRCCTANRRNAIVANPSAITASVTVNAPGSGYVVGDVLTVTQTGSSSTAAVTVTSVTTGGGVVTVSLSANGSGYSTASGVPTTGGKGSGCTLNIVSTPNGIDYLEVLDHEAIALNIPRQQTLLLYCLLPVPANLTPDNIMIEGGESITDITVSWVAPATAPPAALTTSGEQSYLTSLPNAANVLVVTTNQPGDFSRYRLRLVNSVAQANANPFAVTTTLQGFDPQLAEVEFSFKVECGPQFDCNPPATPCQLSTTTPPAINYLAKDYGSFRTLMLDRLTQLLPNWSATSEADLGIVLAELIAFEADYLSYQQDAIATEAYLETARSRVSLRRHALLMDYHVHDGCNARVWIHLTVAGNPGDQIVLDDTALFFTSSPGMPASLQQGASMEDAVAFNGVQVFEPMQQAVLYPEHNTMPLYTWGEANCCLPQGATQATLLGSFPNLQPGDVLIFQEVLGPQTGNTADADLRHRCAVRLTQVAIQDANGHSLFDPLFGESSSASNTESPIAVTQVQWSQDDALPFPVCLSSTYQDSSGQHTITNVSVALGNVILADHGLSISSKPMGTVSAPQLFYPSSGTDPCQTSQALALPVRFRPTLPDSPLTQAVPLPLAGSPVTPSVVLLGGMGSTSLTDSNGFVCVMVEANNPLAWPQFFGLMVNQNATTAANFDLSVVYAPPGGPVGVSGPVVLEKFTNLSLQTADTNYAPFQINSLSRLIQVPSSFAPPSTAPTKFPATPTMLTNTGAVNLQDGSTPPITYLTVQAVNPAEWLAAFGVLAQGAQQQSSDFNLALVYSPPWGGVGVSLPVTVELFTGLNLEGLEAQPTTASELISVKSSAQHPNPSLSAYDLMNFDASDAVPEITLQGTFDAVTSPWAPQQDLLGNSESDRVFVVEVESNGPATLRFATPTDPSSGEQTTNGMVPDAGTSFVANYRIGNGTAGNVGAESLVNLQASDARILSCTNPLPAGGGNDPETNDQIRRRASQAFLSQERSITMTDYEAIAVENSQVDQAVASLRWTGSWYSVFVAAEPKGGGNLTTSLQQTLTAAVDRYRLAGQGLQLQSPQYVPLQIELQVNVDANYFQADVKQALLQVLGNQMLPNGQKGLFYPDNFTFGQTVYLSPVYAAARTVAGVTSVIATLFQPQGVNSTRYLASGEIKLGSLQVGRLDNDPNYPNHGQLTLNMQGGK